MPWYWVLLCAVIPETCLLRSLPDEDQGVVMTLVELPPGNPTLERTDKVVSTMTNYFLENEKEHVESVFTMWQVSPSRVSERCRSGLIKLKDWSSITCGISSRCHYSTWYGAKHDCQRCVLHHAATIPCNAWNWVCRLALTYSSKLASGQNHDQLLAARNTILGLAAQDSRLAGVRPNGQEDTPQYRVIVDHAQAGALGVSVAEINSTMGIAWGGSYIDDFIDRGRVKKVYVQGEAGSRMMPEIGPMVCA